MLEMMGVILGGCGIMMVLNTVCKKAEEVLK